MTVHVGDDIEVDSEKAGTPPREGKVLEVIEAEWGTRYRVRWEDGHETTVHPVAGTVHIGHHDERHDEPRQAPPEERHCPSDIESADCAEALSEVWR